MLRVCYGDVKNKSLPRAAFLRGDHYQIRSAHYREDPAHKPAPPCHTDQRLELDQKTKKSGNWRKPKTEDGRPRKPRKNEKPKETQKIQFGSRTADPWTAMQAHTSHPAHPVHLAHAWIQLSSHSASGAHQWLTTSSGLLSMVLPIGPILRPLALKPYDNGYAVLLWAAVRM